MGQSTRRPAPIQVDLHLLNVLLRMCCLVPRCILGFSAADARDYGEASKRKDTREGSFRPPHDPLRLAEKISRRTWVRSRWMCLSTCKLLLLYVQWNLDLTKFQWTGPIDYYDVIRAKPDGSCGRPAETGPSML